jgi:hypothetical protein
MAEWWSIEVFRSELPAGRWRDAHSSMLIESTVMAGATGRPATTTSPGLPFLAGSAP